MIQILFAVPLEFFLFGATLLGVAIFHYHGLRVAVIGLAAIIAFNSVCRASTKASASRASGPTSRTRHPRPPT